MNRATHPLVQEMIRQNLTALASGAAILTWQAFQAASDLQHVMFTQGVDALTPAEVAWVMATAAKAGALIASGQS